jgi:hypothetical protein
MLNQKVVICHFNTQDEVGNPHDLDVAWPLGPWTQGVVWESQASWTGPHRGMTFRLWRGDERKTRRDGAREVAGEGSPIS